MSATTFSATTSPIATEAIKQKSFTFDQVKSEVLTRINDPLGDTYSDRAKELIYEGICAIALSGYSRDGYPLIAKTESYDVKMNILLLMKSFIIEKVIL